MHQHVLYYTYIGAFAVDYYMYFTNFKMMKNNISTRTRFWAFLYMENVRSLLLLPSQLSDRLEHEWKGDVTIFMMSEKRWNWDTTWFQSLQMAADNNRLLWELPHLLISRVNFGERWIFKTFQIFQHPKLFPPEIYSQA